MPNEITKETIEKLVDQITRTYQGDSGINFLDVANLPVRDKILQTLDLLTELLFPGYAGKRTVTSSNVNLLLSISCIRFIPNFQTRLNVP